MIKKKVQLILSMHDYGPNHFLHCWQISVKTFTQLLHLTGALMEHFLEVIAPLSHWYVPKYKYIHTTALTENFLQRNVSLRLNLCLYVLTVISQQRSKWLSPKSFLFLLYNTNIFPIDITINQPALVTILTT